MENNITIVLHAASFLEFLVFLSSVSVSNMGTLHSTQSTISFNLISYYRVNQAVVILYKCKHDKLICNAGLSIRADNLLHLLRLCGPLMLPVNLPVADTGHSQSIKFVMGVKIKATEGSKLNGSSANMFRNKMSLTKLN